MASNQGVANLKSRFDLPCSLNSFVLNHRRTVLMPDSEGKMNADADTVTMFITQVRSDILKTSLKFL